MHRLYGTTAPPPGRRRPSRPGRRSRPYPPSRPCRPRGMAARRPPGPARRRRRGQGGRCGRRHPSAPNAARPCRARPCPWRGGCSHARRPTYRRRAGAPEALRAHRRAKGRAPGHQDADQVGDGGSCDEKARCGCRKPDHFGGPGDHLAFYFNGRVVAAAKIGVQPACQHFGQHPDRRAGAMYPSHEARVQIANGVGQDKTLEVLVGGPHVTRGMRERLVQFCTQCVWHRLPNRAGS